MGLRGTVLNLLKVCEMKKRVGNKHFKKKGMLGKGVGALKKEGDCDPLTNYKPILKCLFNELVPLLILQDKDALQHLCYHTNFSG